MPYKSSDQRRKKSLEYYYKNKEKVLSYQKARLKKKYQEDPAFRKKRQLRDKSRMNKGKMDNLKKDVCCICSSSENLQRHHPSYDNTEFIIVCRKCHNNIHNKNKQG